jgi:hypothetical protein
MKARIIQFDEIGSPSEVERDDHGAGHVHCVSVSGFSVHAGVSLRAGQREKLERLCRYMARPRWQRIV